MLQTKHTLYGLSTILLIEKKAQKQTSEQSLDNLNNKVQVQQYQTMLLH